MAKGKDYLAIARKKITRPSKMPRLPKVFVYSRNKKGKTYFGISAGIKRTLVLDPEEGTALMRRLDPAVWPITKWSDVDEAYKYLRLIQDDEDRPYDWAHVDGLTKLHSMALRFVMKQAEEKDLDRKPGTITQKDYGRAGELMKDLINNLVHLKMGVVFTAQERVDSKGGDDDEDEEASAAVRFVPDLPQGVRGFVLSEVDVIGRLYITRVTLKGGKEVPRRRLRLAPHEKYDTGYRSDYTLPDYIDKPTIPKLVKLIMEGEE